MIALKSLDDAVTFFAQSREALGTGLTAFKFISAVCVPLLARHFPTQRWPFNTLHPMLVLVEISDLRVCGLFARATRKFKG
jgi:hypothetical protein